MIRDLPLENSQKEYILGGIFSLTGYLSWLGNFKMKAATLKVELLNRSGGIKGKRLKLIVYDDHSSEERAEEIAKTLVLKQKAIALLGTTSLPISFSVARIANEYKIPAILNSGYSIDTGKDLFVFNTSHRTDFMVVTAFLYFMEMGINRVALLMPKGPLGELASSLARELSKFIKIKIVDEERFDLKSCNMKAQLERLKLCKPHAIFSFVTGKPAASVAWNMANLNYNIPLLVSHGNATSPFFRSVSKLPIQIIIPSGKIMAIEFLSDKDPSQRKCADFNKLHLERYNEPANYCSAEEADAIDLIAKALEMVEGKVKDLKDALESIVSFPGMQGMYNFSKIDHYGTDLRDVTLVVINRGEIIVEKRFTSLTWNDAVKDILEGFKLTKNNSHYIFSDQNLNVLNESDSCRAHHILKYLILNKNMLLDAFNKRDKFSFKFYLDIFLRFLMKNNDITMTKIFFIELIEDLFNIVDAQVTEDLLILKYDSIKKLLYHEMFENLALEFFKTINLLTERHLLSKKKYPNKLLVMLSQIIEKKLSSKVTVKEIAKEIGISPYYLMHKVKKHYNITLKDFINKYKIDKAEYFLSFTDMPLSAIAYTLGFCDQSHFTKVFKKYTNLTPMAYRRNISKRFVVQ